MLLAIDVALLALLAVFRVLEQALIRRAERGELVPLDEALRSDERIEVTAGMWLVAVILTGIVWLVWQHRSQSNLRAAGRPDLTYTPGWAVGWWLIPIANLWMPFNTVRELWKASGPDQDWNRTTTWSVLGWWWSAWIAQGVLGRVAAAMLNSADDVASATAGSRVALLSILVGIVAGILAIRVVRSTVARQEGLRASRGDMVVPPPRPDIADRGDAPAP